MSDKDFFENNPVLQQVINPQETENKQLDLEISNRQRYEDIMAKPLLSGQDVLDLPYEPNDYIIENFLWRNDIAFIIAKEKSGKSVFSSQMAQAITIGEPFLEAFDTAKPLNVLYIQAEGTMEETQDRIKNSLKKIKWDKQRWRHHFPAALALDTEEGYDDLKKRIKADGFNPDIIFIDPLYMAMEGDLNDNKAARAFCRNIRRLKKRFSTSIVCVHHEHRPKSNAFGKAINEGDESIMGSFVWKAFASHTLRIERNMKTGLNTVTCARSRNNNVVKEIVLAYDAESETFYLNDSKPTSGSIDMILKYIKFNGGSSAKRIIEDIGIPQSTVRKAFTSLRKSGVIEIQNTKGKEVIYGLK